MIIIGAKCPYIPRYKANTTPNDIKPSAKLVRFKKYLKRFYTVLFGLP